MVSVKSITKIPLPVLLIMLPKIYNSSNLAAPLTMTRPYPVLRGLYGDQHNKNLLHIHKFLITHHTSLLVVLPQCGQALWPTPSHTVPHLVLYCQCATTQSFYLARLCPNILAIEGLSDSNLQATHNKIFIKMIMIPCPKNPLY